MYALPNKTQHKLIVKVRGGISQKLDNLTSSPSSSSTVSTSSSSGVLEASTNSRQSRSNNNLSSPLAAAFQSTKESGLLFNTKASLHSAGFDPHSDCLPQPVFHSLNQHGGKQKSMSQRAQKQQYISPEHNEMINYFQQSWKGVERDYKKSVNNFINNLDLNSSDNLSPMSHLKQKQVHAKKKTATTSTPLLLTGSYHHTSSFTKDSASNRQDSFQPFDLEAFWGNRMFKRLTEEL